MPALAAIRPGPKTASTANTRTTQRRRCVGSGGSEGFLVHPGHVACFRPSKASSLARSVGIQFAQERIEFGRLESAQEPGQRPRRLGQRRQLRLLWSAETFQQGGDLLRTGAFAARRLARPSGRCCRPLPAEAAGPPGSEVIGFTFRGTKA